MQYCMFFSRQVFSHVFNITSCSTFESWSGFEKLIFLAHSILKVLKCFVNDTLSLDKAQYPWWQSFITKYIDLYQFPPHLLFANNNVTKYFLLYFIVSEKYILYFWLYAKGEGGGNFFLNLKFNQNSKLVYKLRHQERKKNYAMFKQFLH